MSVTLETIEAKQLQAPEHSLFARVYSWLQEREIPVYKNAIDYLYSRAWDLNMQVAEYRKATGAREEDDLKAVLVHVKQGSITGDGKHFSFPSLLPTAEGTEQWQEITGTLSPEAEALVKEVRETFSPEEVSVSVWAVERDIDPFLVLSIFDARRDSVVDVAICKWDEPDHSVIG